MEGKSGTVVLSISTVSYFHSPRDASLIHVLPSAELSTMISNPFQFPTNKQINYFDLFSFILAHSAPFQAVDEKKEEKISQSITNPTETMVSRQVSMHPAVSDRPYRPGRVSLERNIKY